MSRGSIELADQFFDKEDVSTVDFEITLAALLGTALITYPVENHILFGQVVAFSLLSLTLIRRMAITSPFASEKAILGYTTPLISFASASALIYLIVTLLPNLTNISPISSQVILFAVFGLLLLIFAVVAQELVFRDYLPWWYVKFKQKSEEQDLLEAVWRDTAILAYWASTARRNRETYRELGNRLDNSRPDMSDFDFTLKEAAKYVLTAVLFLFLLYLVPILYSGYLFGLEGVLVMPTVVFIHDHSAFWYIAYGNPSYEDLRRHIVTILVRTGLYITEVGFLLSHLHITSPVEII
jgi:hypothetical protein